MQKFCSVNVIKDISSTPNVEAWFKQGASEIKVGPVGVWLVLLWLGEGRAAVHRDRDGLHQAGDAHNEQPQ